MERSVASINCPWLNEGVTIEIRGHSRPSLPGNSLGELSSVQGQPVLPGGGGGSSVNVGHRMIFNCRIVLACRVSVVAAARTNKREPKGRVETASFSADAESVQQGIPYPSQADRTCRRQENH